jgi:hypothetical protein
MYAIAIHGNGPNLIGIFDSEEACDKWIKDHGIFSDYIICTINAKDSEGN